MYIKRETFNHIYVCLWVVYVCTCAGRKRKIPLSDYALHRSFLDCGITGNICFLSLYYMYFLKVYQTVCFVIYSTNNFLIEISQCPEVTECFWII